MATRSYAIIGLGRFGESIVDELMKKNFEVLVIDKSAEKIAKMSKVVSHAVTLDSTDILALKEVGIQSIDHVIVAIGDDVQASIMTTMLLIELGVTKITVKVQNEYHAKVVEKLGDNKVEVVQVEKSSGRRLARKISNENVLEYIDLDDEHSVVTIPVGSKFTGLPLKEYDFRGKFGINIVAIERTVDNKNNFIIPDGSFVLEENDVVWVIGTNEDVETFTNKNKK